MGVAYDRTAAGDGARRESIPGRVRQIRRYGLRASGSASTARASKIASVGCPGRGGLFIAGKIDRCCEVDAGQVPSRRLMERCRRSGAPVSVMMFDLDRFKAVNDSHGHAIGDAVIRKFCEITTAALRPNDVFGRLGGEEFAVVLPGSSIEAAYARAERIRASFAESCQFVQGRQVNATVSGGVSVSLNAGQTLDGLLEDSDFALYGAKADGRNRIRRADQNKPDDGMSNVFRVA